MSNITECLIYRHSLKHPKDIAIKTDTETLSYTNLHIKVCEIQSNIKDMGIKRGDTIAIIQEQSLELITVIIACFREGIIISIMNPKWPKRLLETKLERLSPTFCTHSENLTITFLSNKLNLKELTLKKKINPHEWSFQINPSQITTILFSSGCAGNPKMIAHRYNNHYYNALGSNQNIIIERDDSYLLSLPLYHVSGLSILFRTFLAGATLRLSQKSIYTCLKEDSITHASMVHTQLKQLTGDDYRLKNNLKSILIGGSKIPESLIQDALDKHYPIYTTYGLSEMSAQVCTSSPNDSKKQRIHYAGKCLPFRDVKVDHKGHILVKGYTLFAGYYEHGTISLPLNNDGWFDTNDIGQFDGNYLQVTGRNDTMFISGGENIYPEEIESQLCKLSNIDYAMVVPIPNKNYGFRPIAYISTSNNTILEQLKHNTLPTDYLSELKTVLPSYKVPDQFYIWPEKLEQTKKSRQTLLQKGRL